MKISELFSKLEKSRAFRDFKKSEEGKSAFLCAGFFILNFKQNMSEYSFDFRNDKEIFTFKIPSSEDSKEEIIMSKEELISSRKQLGEIEESGIKKLKTSLGELKKAVEEQLKKNKIENSLEEIIAVLQSGEDKKLAWNMTAIASGFTIISLTLDARNLECLKFGKKNLLDFVSVKKQ